MIIWRSLSFSFLFTLITLVLIFLLDWFNMSLHIPFEYDVCHNDCRDTWLYQQCGRDFTTNTSLKHHMARTHNSHANIKSCNHCEKFFKSLETLGKHKKLLHENSFKKYPCVAKHYRARQIWSITSSDIIPTRSFLVKRVAKPSQLTKIFWNTLGGITPGGKRVSIVDSVNSSSMTSMDWETTWSVSTIRYCEVCQLCDH